MDNTSEILHELRAEARAGETAEKAKMVRDMDRTAAELKARGSQMAEGRGQAIGSIPARLYFRWQNMLPGCWQDREFVAEFLADNPQCAAPGYKPRASSLRHSITFGPGAQFYHQYKNNPA